MKPLSIRRLFPWLLSAIVLACMAVTAQANSGVYRKVASGTAWILAAGGQGSGCLIDREQRLVVTNYHVVEEATDVTLFFPSWQGRRLEADPDYYFRKLGERQIHGRVIARDARRDLALIQLDWLPAECQAIPLGESSAEPAQVLHAIGNSGATGGVLWRYSRGEVRQVFRKSMTYSSGQAVFAVLVETQAPINAGDSGGPMVDDAGRLLAITAASDERAEQVNYGVDISEVRRFLREAKIEIGGAGK